MKQRNKGWPGDPRGHREAYYKGKRPTARYPTNRIRHYDDYPGGAEFEYRLDGNAQNIEDRLRDGEKRSDVEWDLDEIKESYRLMDRKQKAGFQAHAVKNYPRFSKAMGWK